MDDSENAEEFERRKAEVRVSTSNSQDKTINTNAAYQALQTYLEAGKK